jgi:hypothetical protein
MNCAATLRIKSRDLFSTAGGRLGAHPMMGCLDLAAKAAHLCVMRGFALLFLVVLAGCNSIARQNGDYFQAGADIGRFEADDQACAVAASDYTSYDLHGMDGTFYDRNRAYNAVYGRCMRARGYTPRPYARNWLLPAG